MMFLTGEVVHRNLSRAYTDLPAFLSTLKTGDFSGIIEIEFPENNGVIFTDSGAKERPQNIDKNIWPNQPDPQISFLICEEEQHVTWCRADAGD